MKSSNHSISPSQSVIVAGDSNSNAAIYHAGSEHGRARKPKQLTNSPFTGETRLFQRGLPKLNGDNKTRTIECFPNALWQFKRYSDLRQRMMKIAALKRISIAR